MVGRGEIHHTSTQTRRRGRGQKFGTRQQTGWTRHRRTGTEDDGYVTPLPSQGGPPPVSLFCSSCDTPLSNGVLVTNSCFSAPLKLSFVFAIIIIIIIVLSNSCLALCVCFSASEGSDVPCREFSSIAQRVTAQWSRIRVRFVCGD